MQYILGIDPGLGKTGYCLMTSKEEIICTGIIKPKQKGDGRYFEIANNLDDIIRENSLEASDVHVAIESPYLGFNPGTAIKLSFLRGFIAGYFNLNDWVSITPAEGKKILNIKQGRVKREESKQLVKEAVIKRYSAIDGIEDLIEDEYDAITIALAGIDKIKLELLNKLI